MTESRKAPTETCEEWFYLSLHEITSSLGVPREIIMEIIDEGIISIHKNENDEWQFDNEALRCIRTVLQLNRDLGINVAGAGLALELLKEIDHLRTLLANKEGLFGKN
ncbi:MULTISPECIES: chaperone modulator CbpM [Legionella]|uniref:Putative chaperone-modulator protein CbpM n=1 Tax=Legionella donaldsonii TaxID=45060 RepID=A0A378JA26_9GAMM|nr:MULTISPECIES: chaperone modulator CbpM [Legionella]MCC5014253.1 chaperone modulator CbpM [Legionella sp. 31fI33]STX43747.1 putative chaperone-modulator protein CbpM [Legionella donaldsonii]